MPWRKIATITLVVITSLFVLVASIAVWGKRTLFDTNRFTKVVASVLDDPAVTNAMATSSPTRWLTPSKKAVSSPTTRPSSCSHCFPCSAAQFGASWRSRSTSSSHPTPASSSCSVP